MAFNWVAVILLLISYLAAKASPAHFAVIALFGLVYPIIFFVNLFFVAFWTVRKDARLLLSLLVMLMGIPHIKDNFSFHKRQNIPLKSDIRILSYNVQGFTNQNEAPYNPKINAGVHSFLKNKKADIICLQEYAKVNPDLFLKNLGKNFVFRSYYTQKGTNTGLAIFSRYKIYGSRFLKFKGYRTFGISANIIVRNDTLRLINVHLASISLEQADLDLLTNASSSSWENPKVQKHFLDIYRKLQKAFRLRERQLGLVLKYVKASPYPVVLCGDFNDTPSSNAYHRVASVLTDAFVERGTGLSATYAGPLPFLRIDYFFTSPGLKVVSYKKYHLRFSDHFPLSMTFRIVKEN